MQVDLRSSISTRCFIRGMGTPGCKRVFRSRQNSFNGHSSPGDACPCRCSHSRHSSSATLHTETFLCPGCGDIISVAEEQETLSTGTNRQMQSSREHRKFIRDRLCYHLPFRKSQGNGSPCPGSPRTNESPKDSISTWEARRGKRALLCGVTYNKQKFKLKGTIHDVTSMSDLLIHRFGFQSSSIHILAEKESYHHPTKRNIQEALRWLVKDCKSGDSLVFYFSGHGLQQPDFDDDELDGFDETICPLDFRTAGMIIDNELNETIVRPLQDGVKLHAIIDACHSGTILDLPHVYSPKEKKWVNNRPPSGVYKGTSGGRAVSLSACEDNQLAADTSAFSVSGKQMEGAMTYTFKKAVKENPRVTYGDLLASMHKDIMEARAKCFSFRGIFRRWKLQEPLLSSSEEFDINEEFVL